ncbi:ALG6/ALG8 family glucosyltransferase xit [Brevipalpus obovatus]|uniref:ALG6/ALG8 family glucosyltransferase xit n=1 Tax=Brevipalpus obovatus TaxID=246614 RepID=UPI003D9EA602
MYSPTPISTATMDLFYLISVSISVTCLKFLLLPSYQSTDFEVHRNWLAITYSKPLSQWYTESTSKWTLDYPPLFAWFEFALSQFAVYFDPEMLKISSTGYISYYTILFQRLTVNITDFVYVYAAYQWIKIMKLSKKVSNIKVRDELYHPSFILSFLFLWNPGLLIIDHMHFQYNGLLSGIFLLSIARMVQHREVESAFWFAVLLNMKQIYLYVAPIYFVYLLRVYCMDKAGKFLPQNFMKLAGVVSLVFLFSWTPFIYLGQTKQVLSRLFPFGRGLTHAYWAPNFWALYNGLDKFLSFLLGKKSQSLTRGLVKQDNHTVLPNVPPFSTILFCCLAMTPLLINVWRKAGKNRMNITLFTRSVVACAFVSFIFGYHVHEKAILLAWLPLTPLALLSVIDANIYILLSTLGTFSFFPLLIKEAETPTKICLLIIYGMYTYQSLSKLHGLTGNNGTKNRPVHMIELIYLTGIPVLQFLHSFGAYFSDTLARMEFLPLLLISTYCAFGMTFLFIKSYLLTLLEDTSGNI